MSENCSPHPERPTSSLCLTDPPSERDSVASFLKKGGVPSEGTFPIEEGERTNLLAGAFRWFVPEKEVKTTREMMDRELAGFAWIHVLVLVLLVGGCVGLVLVVSMLRNSQPGKECVITGEYYTGDGKRVSSTWSGSDVFVVVRSCDFSISEGVVFFETAPLDDVGQQSSFFPSKWMESVKTEDGEYHVFIHGGETEYHVWYFRGFLASLIAACGCFVWFVIARLVRIAEAKGWGEVCESIGFTGLCCFCSCRRNVNSRRFKDSFYALVATFCFCFLPSFFKRCCCKLDANGLPVRRQDVEKKSAAEAVRSIARDYGARYSTEPETWMPGPPLVTREDHMLFLRGPQKDFPRILPRVPPVVVLPQPSAEVDLPLPPV